jgi:23S rRNA (cytosine1962-C5)-methyltransferase
MTHPIHQAIIYPDRTRPFALRHPWVFAGAIQEVRGNPQDGDLIDLVTPEKEFLGRGYWNSQSQIRVHVLSWSPDEVINEDWWADRLQQAIWSRATLMDRSYTDAYRMVNAENDGLPGLIVDRYGDYLVLQALTLGIDQRKTELTDLLNDLVGPSGIYERSDVEIRTKEGLPPATGVLRGKAPPPLFQVIENKVRFWVDVYKGHKTGFYLDQRDNRHHLYKMLSAFPEDDSVQTVLNCFSYTGGFSVYAAHFAERVINVDSSEDALTLARQNMSLNHPHRTVDDADFVEGNVFSVLREYRANEREFDVIILDPPKFAQNQRQLESATRGYKDINLLALQLIKPGGLLYTFSCSGAVDTDLFGKVVFGALADSGREGQIIGRLGPGPDHPVSLTFPEGAYLKGLACRVW